VWKRDTWALSLGRINRKIEIVSYGSVAEWSNASVLKTEGPKGSVGSNPTTSFNGDRLIELGLRLTSRIMWV
jgi:hypothetical protein